MTAFVPANDKEAVLAASPRTPQSGPFGNEAAAISATSPLGAIWRCFMLAIDGRKG
jgi:hypothetical protein